MAPTLVSKALERAGVPPVGSAFLPIFGPLGVLSLVSTCCGPCAMASRCAADWGSLFQTSLAIMGAGAVRSAPVCPVPSHGLSVWGYSGHWARAVAPSCPSQCSHQFSSLVPQFHSALCRVCGHSRPSPYFIMGFLILAFCLVGSNHQLGISSPGVAIEIPYGIWCACRLCGRDDLWGAFGPLDPSLSWGTAT